MLEERRAFAGSATLAQAEQAVLDAFAHRQEQLGPAAAREPAAAAAAAAASVQVDSGRRRVPLQPAKAAKR